MNIKTIILLTIFIAISVSPSIAQWERPTTGYTNAEVTLPSKELGVLLNQARLQNSRQALTQSEELTRAAQKHADDMRAKNYFSHTGQNGSSHFQRIEEENYTACYTAENIAKGQKTPAAVMNGWMNSKGHRTNNLSTKAREYGIGRTANIWVLVFASKCKA